MDRSTKYESTLVTLGNLSNHTKSVIRTLKICIFNKEKKSFARFASAFFIFVHFKAVRSRHFDDVK